MLHTLVATVENKPGVLNRVSSLLRRRNFNISSLTVGETENPAISRMTIVMDTATTKPHIVIANLYKLVNVIEVRDITSHARVERDLALIKVRADTTTRPDIMQFTELYKAKIVAVAHDALVLEITGTPQEVESFIELIQPFGLLEITRTGVVAMQYGSNDPATRQPASAAVATNGTKKSAHYVQPLAEREGV